MVCGELINTISRVGLLSLLGHIILTHTSAGIGCTAPSFKNAGAKSYRVVGVEEIAARFEKTN